MQTLSSTELSLFYVYAPQDQMFCATLDTHLATMKRGGWLRTWHDHDIKAGQTREQEITHALSTADIILLLISADFLASEDCYRIAKDALKQHERGKTIVVPILIRPVDWNNSPFHLLQALPKEGKAITSWVSQDQAFFEVAQELRQIIEQRRSIQSSFHISSISPVAFWTVPFRQNQFFTGRADILEHIAAYFSSWKTVNTPIAVLSGLGGIGKTQIALEYAYQSLHTYQAFFWIRASSEATFLADIIALADTVGLPPSQGQEPSTAIMFVKRWLSGHTQWLLILDAVSHLSLVTDVLPLRSSGHVLFTTQAPISRAYAHSLEIEKLSEQEALILLLRRSGFLLAEQSLHHISSQDMQEAHALCLDLDGLPLALDQAGAYIEETGCSFADYHQRYQQQQLTLLDLRGDLSTDHPASVVTTWSLSFEYLEPRNPSATDLLRACAFLAPEVIPQDIFLQGAAHLGPHLASFLTNKAHFDAAIKMLRQFALVKRFPPTQTISLHRLVQVVLRSQMEPDVQALWAKRVVQAICASFPHKEDQEWARCSLYIPHVYLCEKHLENYHLDYPAVGALFYRAGCFFHEQAQYKQAEYFYQHSLSLQKAVSAPSEELATVLDSLGWLALDQGRFTQAKPFFQQALTLKEHLYGHDHVKTARTLHALGRLAQAQYQYKEAEALYQQALLIKEHIVGQEHTEAATTLHALGWLFQDQGQYDKALPYYQKTFEIRSKLLGAEHINTSTILHQLARLAQHQKQYKQAEKLYLQSLAIKEKALGLKHPYLAIGMDALAKLYQNQGRCEEAETYYQNALSIREHCFGPEHPFTAEIMHHLACLYQDQGQLQQAETLLVQALNIREQSLGSTHPITAISLHQLARLSSTQHDWEKAEIFYQQTLAIREQALGVTHPATTSVRKGYSRLLRSLQRDAEAQALEQRNR